MDKPSRPRLLPAQEHGVSPFGRRACPFAGFAHRSRRAEAGRHAAHCRHDRLRAGICRPHSGGREAAGIPDQRPDLPRGDDGGQAGAADAERRFHGQCGDEHPARARSLRGQAHRLFGDRGRHRPGAVDRRRGRAGRLGAISGSQLRAQDRQGLGDARAGRCRRAAQFRHDVPARGARRQCQRAFGAALYARGRSRLAGARAESGGGREAAPLRRGVDQCLPRA